MLMIRKLLMIGAIVYFLLAKKTGDELYVFLAAYLSVLTLAVWCRKKEPSRPAKKNEDEA
jgi:hypothetical protein